MKLKILLAALSACFAVTETSSAAVVITATESGGNVEVTATGTLDLSGGTYNGPFLPGSGVNPEQPGITIALTFVDQYGFSSVTGPSNYGIDTSGGTGWSASGVTGDNFGFIFDSVTNSMTVRTAFTGSQESAIGPISSSMTFNTQTFAGLGITPGTYVWTLNNGDSITLQTAAIPEPATSGLLAGVLVSLVVARRRSS